MAPPPRKDVERYPNGRIKPNQGGTPETVAKHLAWARAMHIPASKDPGYAQYTVGVLEARGLIETDVAAELIALRQMKDTLFGKGVPSGSSIERSYGSQQPRADDGESRALRERWTAYKDVVATITPRARRDRFENFVLYNRFPEWLRLARLEQNLSYQELHADLVHVATHTRPHRARGEMSDAHANAIGLGASLDELYAP